MSKTKTKITIDQLVPVTMGSKGRIDFIICGVNVDGVRYRDMDLPEAIIYGAECWDDRTTLRPDEGDVILGDGEARFFLDVEDRIDRLADVEDVRAEGYKVPVIYYRVTPLDRSKAELAEVLERAKMMLGADTPIGVDLQAQIDKVTRGLPAAGGCYNSK